MRGVYILREYIVRIALVKVLTILCHIRHNIVN
jgi:hypothetical protein